MSSTSIAAPGSPAMIQPATWRDLNAIRHLEQVCFPKDAWPLWDIIGVLTLPNVVRLKAEIDGKLTGFVAADLRPAQKMAWIATIGVLPEFRRQGVGRGLLEACEQAVRLAHIRLNVRASNKGAIRLYENAGYYQVGVWAAYYQDGEDALIFEKTLDHSGL